MALWGLLPANIAKDKSYNFGVWWFYGWMLFFVAIIRVKFILDKNSYITSKDHQLFRIAHQHEQQMNLES